MRTRTLPILTAGVTLLIAGLILLILPTGARGARDPQSSYADLLQAGGLTREQLVSMYEALAVGQFEVPACVPGQEMFSDVPATSPFCAWIEELARRGITGGCSATEYCPGNPVNRAQMAVFVVKATETCPTLDPMDEMVRVGGVCIDKYEASVWDAPVGGNRLVDQVQIRAACPDDGQNCRGKIFARSVAGVEPAGFITWFQAQQALANSGKRLPTNAEWQMAASGTPDDTGVGTTPCNTRGTLQVTGGNAGCVSDWEAFDMVGNVIEWVADWVPASTDCPGWGDVGGFSSDDFMCLSGASSTITGPGAVVRGGSFSSALAAGPFAVIGGERPSRSIDRFGFRGAR